MLRIPPESHQQAAFDYLRADIDVDLREAGLDEVLASQGFEVPERDYEITGTTEFNKIVVARHIVRSTREGSLDEHNDPFALRIGEEYEVGIARETREGLKVGQRSYRGLLVAHSLLDGGIDRAPDALVDFSDVQIQVVVDSIRRLIAAKHRVHLRYLTKSLLKIDSAGD